MWLFIVHHNGDSFEDSPADVHCGGKLIYTSCLAVRSLTLNDQFGGQPSGMCKAVLLQV
jgi:hypothetical protein